jgi:hypothetical protein
VNGHLFLLAWSVLASIQSSQGGKAADVCGGGDGGDGGDGRKHPIPDLHEWGYDDDDDEDGEEEEEDWEDHRDEFLRSSWAGLIRVGSF